jgi:hypothetical protein
MPLFVGWGPRGVLIRHVIGVYEDTMALAEEELRQADARERREEAKMARTRWLEENRAERSFPCGVVPDPRELETGTRRLNVVPSERALMQVVAAVLPDDVVFLRERAEDVEEVGRIARTAIREVDVEDTAGNHVPEPLRETFEPPAMSLLVLHWTNEGAVDEDRFAFRSTWLAWQAAHWLRSAMR